MDREAGIITKEDIKVMLHQMGIRKGMLVYVQSALRSFGHVVGGAQAIIEALMETVGYEGTIVMPAFTRNLSDPSAYRNGTVPRSSWETIRESAIPFDKKLSVPHNMGEVTVQFMRNDAVLRSNHPMTSFLAWGKYAKLIVEKQPLHFSLSKESPLGKVAELNGYVLMLGMNYDKCEMFHLAQYSSNKTPVRIYNYAIEKANKLNWIKFLDLELNSAGYKMIGEMMEEKHIVKSAYLGNSTCRMFSAREAVACATAYLNSQNL